MIPGHCIRDHEKLLDGILATGKELMDELNRVELREKNTDELSRVLAKGFALPGSELVGLRAPRLVG